MDILLTSTPQIQVDGQEHYRKPEASHHYYNERWSFVAAGTEYFSSDGYTWNSTTVNLPPYPPPPATPTGCYGNADVSTSAFAWGAGSDMFVVGVTYTYAYCCPPAPWTQCDAPPRGDTVMYTYSQVITGPSLSQLSVKNITGMPQSVDNGFVIGGGPNQVLLFYQNADETITAYSSAGLASEFVPITITGLNQDGYGSLNWIHDRFFACGSICFYSVDGMDWTAIVTFQENYPTIRWSGGWSAPGFFTAVSSSTTKSFAYSTSSDGVTWEGQTFPNGGVVAAAFQGLDPSYLFVVDSSLGNLWMNYTPTPSQPK